MEKTSALETPDLSAIIAKHYDGLALGKSNLSCGNALALAQLQDGHCVVDLGCGRGNALARAAELVGPAGQVVGIDCSAKMVEAAEQLIAEKDLSNASVMRSGLDQTNLPGNLADVVLSNCAINHAIDKKAVFKEIFRILKQGGRLVISDIISEEPLPDAVANDPEARAACYGGAICLSEYWEAIRAAGFGSISMLEFSDPYLKQGFALRKITVQATKNSL
jgi:ubiquinone/menaquinone biosynthesis C-methylase UbiE